MGLKAWNNKLPAKSRGQILGYETKTAKNGKPYNVALYSCENGNTYNLPTFRIESNKESGALGKCEVNSITDPELQSDVIEVIFQ